MREMERQRIIIAGGAGLVGQNLVARLRAKGAGNLLVLDKHQKNLRILKEVQPDIAVELADLAEPGEWQRQFAGAEAVVMLQAQIGGLVYDEFERNNISSTRLVLETMKQFKVPYLVHVSSSVLESTAKDFYTHTKREQENLVCTSGIPNVVLRPTLMFGWFDRKHLGWLARFMKKTPIFPIPGDGRYMRQPLYVGDFCDIIISCLSRRMTGGIYNITGHERLDYIDIIREVKRVTGARSAIVRLPYPAFFFLLWLWALVDRNPPFTTQQLAALVAKDEFEVIDWPRLFGVSCTPFADALIETFQNPRYSQVVLEF